MSRHQFHHGRTLDAVELRGAVAMRARHVRVGDRICFLEERFDFDVEEMEEVGGAIVLRFNNDTASHIVEPGEYLYVLRGRR